VFYFEVNGFSFEVKMIYFEVNGFSFEVKAPKVAETWCPDCRGGQKSGGFLVSATFTHQK
jgi:hypothetical protein